MPANVAAVVGKNAYDKYIGMPYVDIPDPFGVEKITRSISRKSF